MKYFDSHRDAKWKGEGLRSGGKSLVLGGSSAVESKLLIPIGGSMKIIGKKRSGNGLVRVQLIGLNDIILFDKNIYLSVHFANTHLCSTICSLRVSVSC